VKGVNGGEITPDMEAWIAANKCPHPPTEAQTDQFVAAIQTVDPDDQKVAS